MFGEGSGRPGRNQPRLYSGPLRHWPPSTCAGGGIGRRARLRALWAVWPVEVRVLFGAWEKPRKWRGFLRCSGRVADRQRWAWDRAWDHGRGVQSVRCVRRRPDQPLDALGSTAQEALLEVPVDLLGGRDRGVPELALDVDQRQPGGRPGGGGRVAQIVKAQPGRRPASSSACLCRSRETSERDSSPPRGPRNTKVSAPAVPAVPAVGRIPRKTVSRRAPKSTERKRSPFVDPCPSALRERRTRSVRAGRSTSSRVGASASLMRSPVAISVSASGR